MQEIDGRRGLGAIVSHYLAEVLGVFEVLSERQYAAPWNARRDAC